MAAALQTTLKNNLMSAYLSAQLISSTTTQLQDIRKAIAMVSYAERDLGLTPAAITATLTPRTEAEIVTLLDAQYAAMAVLIANADYEDVASLLQSAGTLIASVLETYRIFVE